MIAITFHRMGDFFETFGDSAAIVSNTCGITLTKNRAGVPMCGVPAWNSKAIFAELRAEGFGISVVGKNDNR